MEQWIGEMENSTKFTQVESTAEKKVLRYKVVYYMTISLYD